jgi:two-component system chemotaxis response regulator CheB
MSGPIDFPVVLIVASRGGVAALSRVLASFPKDFAAAVVIVQHRAELPGSVWEHVIGRMTPMRVRGIVPGEALKPGVVYLAPPTTHVSVTPHGYLKVTDGQRIRGVLSSANPLFESAGEHLGHRTIAVVLTGWGRDATDGVQAVKHGGGIVIAQDERSSVDFGMPGSAIATGKVDYVRSIEEIGPLIVTLVNQHGVVT